ncbi:MAG: hypothetical protein K2W96_01840 [Gemmataceae bacterium]|nr:hypothetical protein [Gemmataceae bacterium]
MKKLLLAAFLAFAAPLGAADDDKSLSVTAPASVSVTQGKVQTFRVSIKRTGFTDEVKLTFNLSDLKGVKLVEKDTTIAKDKNFGTFTLEAADDAAVTSKGVATVAAEGGGKKTEPAKFTVKVVEK